MGTHQLYPIEIRQKNLSITATSNSTIYIYQNSKCKLNHAGLRKVYCSPGSAADIQSFECPSQQQYVVKQKGEFVGPIENNS